MPPEPLSESSGLPQHPWSPLLAQTSGTWREQVNLAQGSPLPCLCLCWIAQAFPSLPFAFWRPLSSLELPWPSGIGLSARNTALLRPLVLRFPQYPLTRSGTVLTRVQDLWLTTQPTACAAVVHSIGSCLRRLVNVGRLPPSDGGGVGLKASMCGHLLLEMI